MKVGAQSFYLYSQPKTLNCLLSLLRIKNLALDEDLEWELSSGFTAITGETGAGKSIIIGALKLLLGGRADKALIRTGSLIWSRAGDAATSMS